MCKHWKIKCRRGEKKYCERFITYAHNDMKIWAFPLQQHWSIAINHPSLLRSGLIFNQPILRFEFISLLKFCFTYFSYLSIVKLSNCVVCLFTASVRRQDIFSTISDGWSIEFVTSWWHQIHFRLIGVRCEKVRNDNWKIFFFTVKSTHWISVWILFPQIQCTSMIALLSQRPQSQKKKMHTISCFNSMFGDKRKKKNIDMRVIFSLWYDRDGV